MIAAIENAMLARIKAASDSGALGYKLRQVSTYRGDLDNVPEAVKQFPCVWVVFGGHQKPEDEGAGWLVTPLFQVVVAAKNVRNEQASRHGSGDEVGAYQLLTDVLALLSGQALGLDLSRRLAPGAARLIANARVDALNIAAYAQDFTCAYRIEPAPAAATLSDFTRFHADWDVPPFIEPRPEVAPLDDEAVQIDAVDDVMLSTN
jgi:phage gp37-like protein